MYKAISSIIQEKYFLTMSASQSRKKVAIIGAGAAGMVRSRRVYGRTFQTNKFSIAVMCSNTG